MKKTLMSILVCCLVLQSVAQDKLAEYIKTGLANNQVLKEKRISLEQSVLALKTARSYFLPTVGFVTNYSSAQGGRIITFPAGDLLNSAYTTLNQLTSSDKFGQISNVNAQLLPNNFYDARFHITYSLLNTDLHYNKEISKQRVIIQEYEVDTYRSELMKEIKIAYFNYCSSLDAVSIYHSALQLVDQNLKVTHSSLKNGNGLPANVLRVESERQNINAKIIEALNTKENSKKYLNFLINRPLTDSISVDKLVLPDSISEVITAEPNTTQRSELRSAEARWELANNVLKLNQRYFIPKLNAFYDLGSQASNFKYNNQSKYYFIGVQLDIPIFSGGRNQNNVKVAELVRLSVETQKSLLSNQLQLLAETSRNNLQSSLAIYFAVEKELISSRAYFNLIEKGFKEGANSLIEFIDARNQLTSSDLKLNINRYNVLKQLAEYERQIAIAKIN
jgi:outer membrane protein